MFKKILILSVIVALMLSFKGLNKGSYQDFLSRSAFFVFSEIHTAIASVRTGLSDFIEKYLILIHLRDENRRLKTENARLKIQQQQFKELSSENDRLKKMLDLSKNSKLKLLAGQVIGHDILSKDQTFIINKGSKDGVKRFMGVLHSKGVVGFIFRVSPHSSQVISLLHPLSSLPVKNKRTGQKALLLSSKGKAFLNVWNRDFKEGDALVTLSSDQFPAGFFIGKVLPFNQSEKSSNIPVQISFESLEELFVLLKPFKKDSWRHLE